MQVLHKGFILIVVWFSAGQTQPCTIKSMLHKCSCADQGCRSWKRCSLQWGSEQKSWGSKKDKRKKSLLLITSRTGSQSLSFPNSQPTKLLTSRAQTKKKEFLCLKQLPAEQRPGANTVTAQSLESTPEPRSAATIIQRFLTRKWFLMEVAVSYSSAALLSAQQWSCLLSRDKGKMPREIKSTRQTFYIRTDELCALVWKI